MPFQESFRGYLQLEDLTKHKIMDDGEDVFFHLAPRATKRDMSMSIGVIIPNNKFDVINFIKAFNQPLKGAAVYFQNHRKAHPGCLVVFYGKIKWCKLKKSK